MTVLSTASTPAQRSVTSGAVRTRVVSLATTHAQDMDTPESMYWVASASCLCWDLVWTVLAIQERKPFDEIRIGGLALGGVVQIVAIGLGLDTDADRQEIAGALVGIFVGVSTVTRGAILTPYTPESVLAYCSLQFVWGAIVAGSHAFTPSSGRAGAATGHW